MCIRDSDRMFQVPCCTMYSDFSVEFTVSQCLVLGLSLEAYCLDLETCCLGLGLASCLTIPVLLSALLPVHDKLTVSFLLFCLMIQTVMLIILMTKPGSDQLKFLMCKY